MGERQKPPMGEQIMTREKLPAEAFLNEEGDFNWDYFEKNPDHIVPDALNNFEYHLPGGTARKWLAESIQEDPLAAETEGSKKEMRLFTDVDGILSELGITPDEIQTMQEEMERQWSGGQHDESVALQNKLRARIIPVYKKMRQLGYSHEDLIR